MVKNKAPILMGALFLAFYESSIKPIDLTHCYHVGFAAGLWPIYSTHQCDHWQSF